MIKQIDKTQESEKNDKIRDYPVEEKLFKMNSSQGGNENARKR